MPRFLFEASYTVEGLKGLRRQGGSGRREAVAKAAQSVGGRLEHFYFAFGDHDAFAVADLPNNESAAAFALAVSEAGGANVRTVVLLTPEEVDAAAKRSVEYRTQWSGRHATFEQAGRWMNRPRVGHCDVRLCQERRRTLMACRVSIAS
jgi:uncharacterized protein with GYD domain